VFVTSLNNYQTGTSVKLYAMLQQSAVGMFLLNLRQPITYTNTHIVKKTKSPPLLITHYVINVWVTLNVHTCLTSAPDAGWWILVRRLLRHYTKVRKSNSDSPAVGAL